MILLIATYNLPVVKRSEERVPLSQISDLTRAMTEKKDDKPLPLRSRAELLLEAQTHPAATFTPEEYHQLLHELQVHQIELELQNEELRNSQLALEEHRARYMRLYHNAPVGYVVLNAAGIITESNTTFAHMAGTESPHIHGKPFADFLVADDQSIFRARLRSFFKQPENKHIEVRLKSTGKTCRYVDLAATLHNSHENRENIHNELLVTVTDTTARAEAERALQKFQDFVLTIIDSLDLHVCVLDENGTILLVNEAWRRFAAANPPIPENIEEGANYLTICDNATGEDKESARIFAAALRAILRNERDAFTLEYPCHSPTEQRWFVGKATKLISDVVFGKIVVAHENITERKKLEQEQVFLQDHVRQLAKAESLGLMAGAIAHNFNNKLSAVLGNLELALDMWQDGDDMTPCVKNAFKAAWKASEMSGLMLTYLGQTAAEKEPVDLSSICTQAIHVLQLAKPTELAVTTDFPAPGPVVRVNAQQMQQIVSSLVINAWEAMEDEQGMVDVSIGTGTPETISSRNRFPVDWRPQTGEYVCLTVRDNGCGIPDKEIEKIFDPFFTSKFTGRGMGLSVVLGILRSHGGAITVESKCGEGSVFRVFLPLCGSSRERDLPEVEDQIRF